MSEKKFPSSFSTIEIVQQCQYGFDLNFCKDFAEWKCIKDFAYILHDKDEKEDGTFKEPHIHFMVRFQNPVKTSQLLKKLEGVCEVQHLQKMKSWKSAIAYLTHSNVVGKYRYPDTDVISNFDWGIKQNDKQQIPKVQFPYPRQDEIAEGIVSGKIRKYNLLQYVTPVEMKKWRSFLSDMFEYRRGSVRYSYMCGKQTRKILWLSGYAEFDINWFAMNYCKKLGLDFYNAFCDVQNPLREYKDQPAIIFNKLRPENYTALELLTLLDDRYITEIQECKLVIIICDMTPDEFWTDIDNTLQKDITQLAYRISGLYVFEQPGVISHYIYNLKQRIFCLNNKIQYQSPYIKRK